MHENIVSCCNSLSHAITYRPTLMWFPVSSIRITVCLERTKKLTLLFSQRKTYGFCYNEIVTFFYYVSPLFFFKTMYKLMNLFFLRNSICNLWKNEYKKLVFVSYIWMQFQNLFIAIMKMFNWNSFSIYCWINIVIGFIKSFLQSAIYAGWSVRNYYKPQSPMMDPTWRSFASHYLLFAGWL